MRASSIFSFDAGTSTRACLARAALRMRVSMSAIGSVCILSPYQLALVTPGICPTSASSRKHRRHIWNFLRNARERPHRRQRLRTRTLNFGLRAILANAQVLAMVSPRLSPERHTEQLQHLPGLFVRARRGGEGDVHALDLVHPGVVNLRKHQLVLQPERVIAAPVERIPRQAAEVADAGKHEIAQATQELVHLRPAQRHATADGHALADLEIGDGLLGPRGHRLLPGDQPQLHHRHVQQLDVRAGLSHPDVHSDLGDLRRLHGVLISEPFDQRRKHLGPIAFLHPRHHCLSVPRSSISYLSIVALQRRQMRLRTCLLPSVCTAWPTRVARLHAGQTSITLLTLIGASRSTIPPLMFFCGLGRVCLLIMCACSTITVPFTGFTESTRADLAANCSRSRPEITRTMSPLRMPMVSRGALSCLFLALILTTLPEPARRSW